MPITYESIASTTLVSAQSTVTLSNIPLIYSDLILILNIKATSGTIYPGIRLNNDAGANYSRVWTSGRNANAVNQGRSTSANVADITAYAGANTSNVNMNSIIQFNGYTNYSTYRPFLARSNNASNGNVDWVVCNWLNNALVNRIDIIASGSTFAVDSSFNLYGIRAA